MEDLQSYKTEKLGNYILDIAAGPFGSNLKVDCFVPDGFPIIDGANLKDFKVTDNVTKFVTEKKARSLHRSIAKRNDVIVTISGTVGQISYIPKDSKYKEYLVSQRQFRVTFDDKRVYVPYLVYYFHTKEGQHKILSFANQTGVPALAQPLKNFRNIDISLPDISIQKRIVAILESIDNKIALNNRINHNLEEQAQALYKSWFVDFEPFKNGVFVDSELGMIPKGWRVGHIEELISDTYNGDWGKDEETGSFVKRVFCIRGADIPSIRVGDSGKMPTRFIQEKHFQSKFLKDNDIVVEISGGSPTQSTGRFCRVTEELVRRYDNSLICTNFCKALRPKDGYSIYVSYLWNDLYERGILFSYENGTTGIKNLDLNGLLSGELIVIPDKNTMGAFSVIVSSLNQQALFNGHESEKLSCQRDTLIPKLMSGELLESFLMC